MISFKNFSKTYLLSLWLFTLPFQNGLVAQVLPQNQELPAPPPPVFLTPTTPIPLNSPVRQALEQANAVQNNPRSIREISLNFNNVPIIEYIRYISRIAQQNFIFDQDELQFNITVVSEDPVSIDDLMATLLQELRIRDLLVLEQGGNLLIYRNPRIKIPARIISGGTEPLPTEKSEIVTRIFELNTLDPAKASEIVKPLLSDDISVEVFRDSNKLIVTDFVTNVNSIAELLNNLDAPNSGIQIGQYVVRNAFVDSLVELATQIIQPITQGNPFTLIPHAASNSIYVVSNEYIVQKAIAILQNLDMNEGRTKVLTLERLNAEHGPGVTSQGAFKKEEGRGPAGVLGSQGAPQPRPEVNLPPGQATSYPFEGGAGSRRAGTGQAPYGARGELDREGRAPIGTPQGIPPNYPSGGIGSQGQFPPGVAGPGGYPGARSSFRYTGQTEGVVTSEGYYLPPGQPEYPYGVLESGGRPGEYFEEREEFLPGEITSSPQWLRELPTGEIESTVLYKYPVKYRKAANLAAFMQAVGMGEEVVNSMPDVAAVMRTSRAIEQLNAILFVGTPLAIEKALEYIQVKDTPLRQVVIEALILEVDYIDSLNLGVDWATAFGGGGTNGTQAFQVAPNLLGQALSNINLTTTPPILPSLSPAQLPFPGYAADIIGTHITHNGTRFSSFGAFIQAAHGNTKFNIISNPKFLTEANITSEQYIGTVDRYKSQSIPNDLGTLITNNYQYLEVGLTFRVTAMITTNDIITLDIIQERTAPTVITTVAVTSANDTNLVPVLTKDRTVTKVHVPNGFFTVISGVLQDTDTRQISGQIPCLGGIPIIGGLCKNKFVNSFKQNVMLFIRPMIIDTEDDLEDATKRQQDIYCEKSKTRRSWNYEIDETLDLFNIKPTDPDEIGCAGCNQ
jgi:type III secretion protein C